MYFSFRRTIFTCLKTMKLYSVGRCVIPCAFFGKSVKHTFSCRKMYPVYEKICLQFFFCVLTSKWRHKVTFPFLAYLSLESGVLWIPARININCLISCGNFTDNMLIMEHRHWLWFLKRLHLLQNDVCTWKSDVSTKMKIMW